MHQKASAKKEYESVTTCPLFHFSFPLPDMVMAGPELA